MGDCAQSYSRSLGRMDERLDRRRYNTRYISYVTVMVRRVVSFLVRPAIRSLRVNVCSPFITPVRVNVRKVLSLGYTRLILTLLIDVAQTARFRPSCFPNINLG